MKDQTKDSISRTQEQTSVDMTEKAPGVDSEEAGKLSQPDVSVHHQPRTEDTVLYPEPAADLQDSAEIKCSEMDTVHRRTEEGPIKNQRKDSVLLVELKQYFDKVAEHETKISKADFQKALGYKNPDMANRIFAMFDPEGAEYVKKDVLLDGIADLTGGSAKHKLKFLFDVIDDQRRGYLDAAQLRTLLCFCMEESCLKLAEEDIEDMTMTLLESAGKDETEAMTFDELLQLLDSDPDIMDNLTFSMAQWLTASPSSKQGTNPIPSAPSCPWNKRYFRNNAPYTIFMLIYILINIVLFTMSAVRYRTSNWCVIIARGCGMCLNFNGAFIVVPMLRYTLTWVRTTKVASLLPLDHTVYIHKVVGFAIVLQGSIHTVAHLGNYGYLVANPTENGTEPLEYWEYIFTAKPRPGARDYSGITGFTLAVILAVMTACSMPCVRRSGRFEVFFWVHKLYVPFWVFLILHGPIFWMFFLLPALVFVVEVISHSHIIRLITRRGLTKVLSFHVLPSKVTHLEIKRPKNFRYHPGDYIFISIPGITRVEWHPFTISSAPEMGGSIWLHIRSLGNWTNRVYEHFKSLNADGVFRVVCDGATARTSPPVIPPEICDSQEKRDHKAHDACNRSKPVLIDGPYGTPTRDIFDTEHAVLVATGIGVTPFASILQSIMYRYKASKSECPQCDHRWYGKIPETVMSLRKVDFIWVNRDQKCFEWFVGILAQLEVEQAEEGCFENFLDLHLYMTSAVSKNDMKGLCLQLALERMYMKKKKDLVTGLRTRTKPGRPDWGKVFQQLHETKKGKVKVFFCGAETIAQILKQHCAKHNFAFSKETF